MRIKTKKEDLLFMVFCLATAVIFALYRSAAGDFVAYNGDFQNYNIFRRLLDGQVQYRDFTNYIGNGVIFINFPLICLFRSFGNSVFIINFTTSILYSLIVFISAYMIMKDRKQAYIITNVAAIAAFIILHSGFQGSIYYKYVFDVVSFEEPGHSVRTTRAFLPFMLVGIYYLVRGIVKKKNLLLYILRSGKWSMVVYFLLGILTVWSNDFGYACVICLFIIMVIVNLLGRKKPFLNRLMIYGSAVIAAVVGMLLSVAAVTHGHVSDYFAVNKGIMDYQFWYYGNYYDKYFTFFDIFKDKKFVFLTVVFFVHAVAFVVKTVRCKIDDNDICKLFLHSTCYSASLIYVVGSGAHNYTSAEIFTYILALGFIWKAVKKAAACIWKINALRLCVFISKAGRRTSAALQKVQGNKMAVYVIGMLILYCISVNIIRTSVSYTDRDRGEGLKVSSVIGRGLDEDAKEISDGVLFSTYAGALETVSGTFQPTGTDYIIHVLGDKQREKYLDNFTQGDYRYATTLKNGYTLWEYWASRANWFFYRELYANYEPVRETNYSVIWEKSDKENVINTEAELEWEYINGSTCRIDVELPDYEDGAYVDLYIKYNTVWTQDRLKYGGMRKVLCVQDGGEQYNGYRRNPCYYMREESGGCTIPVYVRNGKGYAYISAYPLSCTKLEGVSASVKKVIREPDYSLRVTNYTDICRWIAEDGVDQSGMLLKFDNTEFNTTKLMGAGQLKANGETGIVSNAWQSGDYIYVQLENPINRDNFIYPNEIEAVQKEKVYTVENYTDDEWVCGISRKDGKILINRDIDVDGLYAVGVGEVRKQVTKIELTELGYCISLRDNNGVQALAYPQTIELIYH